MQIKIKYLEGATRMTKIEKGNWIDCYAYEDKTIPYMERGMINLGFALELPEGYEGHLAPRSSTYKTWRIIQTNSVGVVDDSYIGDNDIWHMPVVSLNPNGTQIHAGDKVCQFRIMEVQPEFTLVEVDSFGNADRGGFGTTGTKKD